MIQRWPATFIIAILNLGVGCGILLINTPIFLTRDSWRDIWIKWLFENLGRLPTASIFIVLGLYITRIAWSEYKQSERIPDEELDRELTSLVFSSVVFIVLFVSPFWGHTL